MVKHDTTGLLVFVARVSLVGLTALGYFGTIRFMQQNGTLDAVQVKVASQGPFLNNMPGVSVLAKLMKFDTVDTQIGTVMSFWTSLLKGSLPTASLLSIHYFGQIVALWILLFIEGFRAGNKWTLVSFSMIMGVLAENVGMAVVIPAYCLFYLVKSPIVVHAGSTQLKTRKTMLLVHPAELSPLPWAVIFGYGIPTAFAFHYPATKGALSFESQQFWIVARQLSPIWISVFQLVFSMTLPFPDVQYLTVQQRNQDVLRALKRIYQYPLLIAGVSHIAVVTLSLASQLSRKMFTKNYRVWFSPGYLFQPVPFWRGVRVTHIDDGLLHYLQWSDLVLGVAVLAWAMTLNRDGQMIPKRSSFTSMMGKTIMWTLAGGPIAAAVALIKERDELTITAPDEDEAKKDE